MRVVDKTEKLENSIERIESDERSGERIRIN